MSVTTCVVSTLATAMGLAALLKHVIQSRDELVEHLRSGHLWRERDMRGEWLVQEFDAKKANGSYLVETCDLFALHRELHGLE